MLEINFPVKFHILNLLLKAFLNLPRVYRLGFFVKIMGDFQIHTSRDTHRFWWAYSSLIYITIIVVIFWGG